jgi:hypothetical protein
MGEEHGEPVLNVEPFKVMDRVIGLWRDNPQLIDCNLSFPLPLIVAPRRLLSPGDIDDSQDMGGTISPFDARLRK